MAGFGKAIGVEASGQAEQEERPRLSSFGAGYKPSTASNMFSIWLKRG
jgi:hypothetical protein